MLKVPKRKGARRRGFGDVVWARDGLISRRNRLYTTISIEVLQDESWTCEIDMSTVSFLQRPRLIREAVTSARYLHCASLCTA